MPTYEYLCASGHHFEELQSFSAAPVAVCPRCGSKAQRQISVPTVHFKGSGFYSTDSRASSSATRSSSSSNGGSSEGSSNGTSEKAASPSNGSTADSGSTGKTTHTHGGSTHSH